MTSHSYDDELYVHFVIFCCYRRRRLPDHERARQIVVELLASQLHRQSGRCLGYVVMPDHVHALLWLPHPGQLSVFMKQWKQRSSFHIKRFLRYSMGKYVSTFDGSEPAWQPRYYDFNIYSDTVLVQKLNYIHNNPVRAGLASSPCAWEFSSARWYDRGESVGVPIEFVP